VLTHARARGLITQKEMESLSGEDALSLIFRPGFTTRTLVTDVSGRGIGLDAVRQILGSLGGSVDVETMIGAGTTFRLVAPVSTVLSRALVMEIADGRYAVSSEAVASALEIDDDDLQPLGQGLVLRTDGVPVRITDLGQAFHNKPDPKDNKRRAVVILQQRGLRRAFVVSRLLGERQVVQRTMGPFFEGVTLVNGTALLEGGDLALMLNVATLMQDDGQLLPPSGGAGADPTGPGARPRRAPLILVVDDSEMTRDMVVSSLRARGFRVAEAVNGADALRRAEMERPDLILTDLEMPLVNGFELLRSLRALPHMAELPVVVLSTRGADEDKRKAAELGANAYLVKTAFKEAELLGTITHFVPVAQA
jgi:two-component system chemotaxis sensor kinase CheA